MQNLEFINHLGSKFKGSNETTVISVRLSNEENAQLQEMADVFGCTRHDIIYEAIKMCALKQWEELRKQNVQQELEVDMEGSGSDMTQSFFMLNTNKANDFNDHKNMLERQIAAAFEDRYVEKINKIKKGDCVFLYESGQGIVAYGIADGVPKNDHHYGIADKMRYQKLEHFILLEKPIAARKIKQILNREIPFAQTMIRLPKGEKLLKAIESK